MIIHNCEQGTIEWFSARAGIPTASCFHKIITGTGKKSDQRSKYLYQLAGEKVSRTVADSYKSAPMIRGTELELEARRLYEFHNGFDVQQVGFCMHDNGLAGCSPDALVGKNGGYEAKCPDIHTHVEYLVKGVLPTKYVPQVQGSLYITGREWWDFMSYYPGIKPFIIRVIPNWTWMAQLEQELIAFNEDLAKLIGEIQ